MKRNTHTHTHAHTHTHTHTHTRTRFRHVGEQRVVPRGPLVEERIRHGAVAEPAHIVGGHPYGQQLPSSIEDGIESGERRALLLYERKLLDHAVAVDRAAALRDVEPVRLRMKVAVRKMAYACGKDRRGGGPDQGAVQLRAGVAGVAGGAVEVDQVGQGELCV